VASEALEESVVALLVDGGEGVEEMEAGNGTARAVGCAVFMREDECGAVGALDDTRGEDADDAAVPAGVGLGGGLWRHNCRSLHSVRKRRRLRSR
jgi:hypothetical protein